MTAAESRTNPSIPGHRFEIEVPQKPQNLPALAVSSPQLGQHSGTLTSWKIN
jgi:hypothetical protein